MQAGKGINISARTFHLAQGDILKVSSHLPGKQKTSQRITELDHYRRCAVLSSLQCCALCCFYFQIYDGKDNTAHVLGAFTGSSMLGLTLISTSNHLWLEFYSDPESTGEGFKLVYSSKRSQQRGKRWTKAPVTRVVAVCLVSKHITFSHTY